MRSGSNPASASTRQRVGAIFKNRRARNAKEKVVLLLRLRTLSFEEPHTSKGGGPKDHYGLVKSRLSVEERTGEGLRGSLFQVRKGTGKDRLLSSLPSQGGSILPGTFDFFSYQIAVDFLNNRVSERRPWGSALSLVKLT
jgi:hypothetical protein